MNNKKEMNVAAIIKGDERYIFVYDDDSKGEMLRTLGRYASDSDLSFTWHDAAILSQKIRQQVNVDVSNRISHLT